MQVSIADKPCMLFYTKALLLYANIAGSKIFQLQLPQEEPT